MMAFAQRTPEVLIRWMEMEAFAGTIYRSHPGINPHVFAQPWSDEVVAYTKLFSRLFKNLKPYRSVLVKEATETGLPVVRHGLMVDPDDDTWFQNTEPPLTEKTLACEFGHEVGLKQFFMGDDVLLAPILNDATI